MSTFEQKLFSALRPKRNKPRRKRQGTRRGPWRSEEKRRYVASLPCLISGRASQCCHVTHNGMASKGSDEYTVPLAPEYHDQADGRAPLPNGEIGRRAFERYYSVDLLNRAIKIHCDWLMPREEPECRCEVSGDWKSGDCEYCRSLRVPHYREAGNAEECPF